MPRCCSICMHHERYRIDQAIARGLPHEAIAQIYTVSMAALARHDYHLNPRAPVEIISDAEHLAERPAPETPLAIFFCAWRLMNPSERAQALFFLSEEYESDVGSYHLVNTEVSHGDPSSV